MNDLNARNLAGEEVGGSKWNVTFPSLPASEDPRHITTFSVDSGALMALSWWFGQTLPGTVLLNMMTQTYSSDLVNGIWNGTTDLNSWIDNVATSVTGVLRTTNTVSYSQYNGTAQGMGVHVRWLWLLLPLALVAMSLLVLVVTIAQTALSPVEAWKGSPLTFLLFGIDEQLKEAAYGQGTEHNGFQKAVGGHKVRLMEGGDTFGKFKLC